MKYLAIITLALLPALTFAQGYTPLVGIPGVDPSANFDKYINTLYALSISIAALLAVIKIIIAGVKWMMTDIVTSKGEAKKDIQGALLGLLIVLGAVLIITVINPDILKVNLGLNKAASPSLPTNAPIAPYTLNPGDKEFVVLATDQNNCKNIVPALCASLPGGIGCSVGEFYPPGETYVCVIRAGN